MIVRINGCFIFTNNHSEFCFFCRGQNFLFHQGCGLFVPTSYNSIVSILRLFLFLVFPLVPTFIQHLFLKMLIGTTYRLKVVVYRKKQSDHCVAFLVHLDNRFSQQLLFWNVLCLSRSCHLQWISKCDHSFDVLF
jgi:hypothetical protein